MMIVYERKCVRCASLKAAVLFRKPDGGFFKLCKDCRTAERRAKAKEGYKAKAREKYHKEKSSWLIEAEAIAEAIRRADELQPMVDKVNKELVLWGVDQIDMPELKGVHTAQYYRDKMQVVLTEYLRHTRDNRSGIRHLDKAIKVQHERYHAASNKAREARVRNQVVAAAAMRYGVEEVMLKGDTLPYETHYEDVKRLAML